MPRCKGQTTFWMGVWVGCRCSLAVKGHIIIKSAKANNYYRKNNRLLADRASHLLLKIGAFSSIPRVLAIKILLGSSRDNASPATARSDQSKLAATSRS